MPREKITARVAAPAVVSAVCAIAAVALGLTGRAAESALAFALGVLFFCDAALAFDRRNAVLESVRQTSRLAAVAISVDSILAQLQEPAARAAIARYDAMTLQLRARNFGAHEKFKSEAIRALELQRGCMLAVLKERDENETAGHQEGEARP